MGTGGDTRGPSLGRETGNRESEQMGPFQGVKSVLKEIKTGAHGGPPRQGTFFSEGVQEGFSEEVAFELHGPSQGESWHKSL